MKHELERILGREISTNYSLGSHLQRFRQHVNIGGNGSEEKPLHQRFYEEAEDIRAKFEEVRSMWYGDEIDWSEMERKATEFSAQFKAISDKYDKKIDWTKLGEEEGHIPSAISCLSLELAMYVGPRNMPPCFDGE